MIETMNFWTGLVLIAFLMVVMSLVIIMIQDIYLSSKYNKGIGIILNAGKYKK